MNRLERVRGCLLGLALGDALGAPVEFLSVAGIDERWGPRGVRELQAWEGHPAGSYTDDTQMTLATGRGLLLAASAGHSDPTPFVVAEYVRWYGPQLTQPAAMRSPGPTCMAACAALSVDPTPRPADNDCKGCGAVMRMAPAGLVGRRPAFGLGAWLGALTHAHPVGYLSAGYLAETVAAAADGAELEEALAAADSALQTVPAAADGWPLDAAWPRPSEDAPCLAPASAGAAAGADEEAAAGGAADRGSWPRPLTSLAQGRDELAASLDAARAAVGSSAPDRAAVAALGGGWTGDEALAIALLCALRHRDDWTAAVVAAADHGGDSDSTACITGAVLGAVLGDGCLPVRWLERLEDRPEVDALADGLTAVGSSDGRTAS